MTGDFGIQMTCPTCGYDLELVNERTLRQEHSSVWQCTECQGEWSLRLDLVSMNLADRPHSPANTRCGTTGGYDKHRRDGTPQCAACLKAHAQQVAESKRRSRPKVGV